MSALAAHRLSRYRRELSVAGAYLLLLLLLALMNRDFFRSGELRGSWTRAAPVLVLGVGMTLVILSRHIDISIGSQFSVCGVIAGLAARQGLSMPAVALFTLASGALLGAFNGAFVAFLRLPSIVVTLATMVILRDGLKWSRQGESVRGLPERFQWFGATQQTGEWVMLLTALAVLGVFAWAMRYLAAGRSVYAVGSDEEAARLAGVRPPRVVFTVFVLMGLLTGVAALLNATRFPIVDVNAGVGLELLVIAAVVVGGTAVAGGRGTLAGTLVGVLLLVAISPALVFLDIRPEWERAIQGLIILLAVASDALARRGA